MSYIAEARSARVPLSSFLFENNKSPFVTPKENKDWLSQYEQLEGSIFKYYNIQNEVSFLKKIEHLPIEKRNYYIEENVNRFLGEFVGKVPYTTIPYEVDQKGISYAGMHVMDSYRKAAELGGQREKAETDGFQTIQDVYTNIIVDGGVLPPGAWISPPKMADYGFVFLFIPDESGNIKEYILRYPELMGMLDKSTYIYSSLSPETAPPISSDSFLRTPLFGSDNNNNNGNTMLQNVMKSIGIDEKIIHESELFERSIHTALSEWIQSYSSLIISLSSYEKESVFYEQGILYAKKLLLSIYQKAQEIKTNISTFSNTPLEEQIVFDTPLSQMELTSYAAAIQHKENLPTASGGSCPAIETDSNPLTSPSGLTSNLDIFNNLLKGKTPESLIAKDRYDDYECPKCGTQITGELIGKPETWKPNCPHCNGALQCAKT